MDVEGVRTDMSRAPSPGERAKRSAWATCLRPGDCVQARPALGAASRASSQWPAAYELNGFLLIQPSPSTFDFSFGAPMYQMMPAPDTSASSSSLAFTVTWPAPCTDTLARLALSSPALIQPAPWISIVRSSTRPDRLPPAAPSTRIDSFSLSSLLASI